MTAGLGAHHVSIMNALSSGVTTATSTGTLWDRTTGTNESMNINDWSQVELQNFVKWFIEVHHPEAVEQYQAIRAIERSAQERERLEYEIQQAEYMKRFWANQARGAQNAYPYSQYPYATTATQSLSTAEPKKESIWDAMKRMAGIK